MISEEKVCGWCANGDCANCDWDEHPEPERCKHNCAAALSPGPVDEMTHAEILRSAAEHFRSPTANVTQRSMASTFEGWAVLAESAEPSVRDRINIRNAVKVARAALDVGMQE